MDFIELFGYCGSFLVLISFLMTSVFKLRIVNTIGSIIFCIYAVIIKSYPTAVMNFCLVLINIHFLLKMSKMGKEYELVKVDKDDSFVKYLLNHYRQDILDCFPNISLEFDNANVGFIITCNGNPVGLSIGHLEKEKLELSLDYSIPEYRDFSIGSFLFNNLKNEGIKKVIYLGPTLHHLDYLNKLGFKNTDVGFEKEL